MELRSCSYCRQIISVTAIYCPACGKADGATINWLKTAQQTAKSIALLGLMLVGPNAIAGAMLGPQMNRPTAKTLREIAAKVGAIDSVPAGTDQTFFFTRTGFLWMFLYGLGKTPSIPDEIPYADFVGARLTSSEAAGAIDGFIECRAPQTLAPPTRPKPIERLLLGKELYAQLVAAADEFERSGSPKTVAFPFSFAGKDADAYAKLLVAKFEEYLGRELQISW